MSHSKEAAKRALVPGLPVKPALLRQEPGPVPSPSGREAWPQGKRYGAAVGASQVARSLSDFSGPSSALWLPAESPSALFPFPSMPRGGAQQAAWLCRVYLSTWELKELAH